MNPIFKGLSLLLILFSFCYPTFKLVERVQWEKDDQSQSVFFAPYIELERLGARTGLTPLEILMGMGKGLLAGVSFKEDSLDSLEKRNLIQVIPGGPIQKDSSLPFDPGKKPFFSTHLLIKDSELAFRMESRFRALRPKSYCQLTEQSGEFTLVLEGVGEEFKQEPLFGFDPQLLHFFQQKGFSLALHLDGNFETIDAILETQFLLNPLPHIETVFFPNNLKVSREREFLLQSILFSKVKNFSIQEFRIQDGVLDFYKGFPNRVTRSHLIEAAEMEKYSPNKVLFRWLRAFKERKIHYGEIRFFFTLEGKETPRILEINEKFLANLKIKMEKSGFQLAKVHEAIRPLFPHNDAREWRHVFYTWLSSIGLLLFFHLLFPLGGDLIVVALFLFVTLFVFSFIPDYQIFRTLFSLLISLSAPLLAIYTLGFSGRTTLFKCAGFFFPVLAGGSLLSLLHHDPIFWLKIEQFRGVKISFLIPLIILAYMQRGIFFNLVRDFLRNPFEPQKISGLILGVLGLSYYLIRSGNHPGLGPSYLEEQTRDFLEWWIYARPRNKEFLLGIPAFFTFLYFSKQGKISLKNSFFLPLFILLGQISTLNSFCHFHTPLTVTLLRTFNGVVLGAGLSAFWILFLEFLTLQKSLFQTDKANFFLLGYGGMGNLGDDLILLGLLNKISEKPGLKRIFLPCGGKIINLPGISNGIELTPIPRFHLVKIPLAILASKEMIVGGGGLFQDKSSRLSFYYYLILTLLGDFFGNQVSHLGQSFNPPKNPFHQWIFKKIIGQSTRISPRDHDSLQYLINLGIPPSSLTLAPDLAFSCKIIPKKGKTQNKIGVVLRDHLDNLWVPGFIQDLTESIPDGAVIQFFSFHPERDHKVNQLIQDNHFELLTYKPEEFFKFMDEFRCCKWILSLRLHGSILSYIQGIPFLPISYDTKIDGWVKEVDYPYLLDIKSKPLSKGDWKNEFQNFFKLTPQVVPLNSGVGKLIPYPPSIPKITLML